MQKYFSLAILIILFAGCSATKSTLPQISIEPAYTLVYVIHGDANYTYHIDSQKYQADEEALSQAIKRAESARSGEVLIFHQKPERKRFLFFPGKDRVFYHYKGGRLVEERSYSPVNGRFIKEAELFRNSRSKTSEKAVFLYFGHEIPSDSSLIYHRSQPQQSFDIKAFSEGLGEFDEKFDLVVLSTCNNGSPIMAQSLEDKADFLVASPRNLHLSHLRSSKLKMLEESPSVSTENIADSIASDSFRKLSRLVQTMVTVGIYNLNETTDYLDGYEKKYKAYLSDKNQETLFKDNTDCNMLSFLGGERLPEKGTKLYYKPPAFGREANLKTHSPWGCKP